MNNKFFALLYVIFKFIIDGLKLVAGEISGSIKGYAGEIGTQIYPAVMSVGYICGPRISSYMFAGGVLSWLVLIPLIVLFGLIVGQSFLPLNFEPTKYAIVSVE